MNRAFPLAATLIPALALGLVACGDDDGEKAKALSTTACGTLPTSTAAATLPANFPLLPGQVLHDQATQGKTEVVYGLVSGGLAQITTARDSVVTLLKSNGYTIEGTDQEKNKEADADFSGPNKGSISVHARCSGYLDIKYTINGS